MGYLNIANHSIIYVDTVIFIYTIEANPDCWELLQPLWIKFQQKEIEIYTSELTLLEVLVQPIKQKDDLLIKEYQNLLLNFGIKLQPITKSILQQAAYLRANNKIKTPDAIHVATGKEINCNIFLTNDLSLKKIPDLPVVTLNEVMNS